VVIIAAILWAFLAVKKVVTKKNQLVTNIDVPQYMPIAPKGPQMGGGGGGGSHDILQAPKGRLPKFEEQPIAADGDQERPSQAGGGSGDHDAQGHPVAQ
jgi:protein TonB